MSNWCFILVALAVFAVRFFLSILFPYVLLADPFIILSLAVFFLPDQKVNLGVLLMAAIFFDLAGGRVFGISTLALVLTMLVIVLIKKVMLVSHRGFWVNLVWLTIFYYLYLVFEQFREFVFPKINLSLLNLGGVVFWTVVMMVLVKKLSHEKRVSSFQL